MLRDGDTRSACASERFAFDGCQPSSLPTLSTKRMDRNNAVRTAPSAMRRSVLHHATLRSVRREGFIVREGFMTRPAAHYASVCRRTLVGPLSSKPDAVDRRAERALGRFDPDSRAIGLDLITHDRPHTRSLDRLHVRVRLTISADTSHVRRKVPPAEQSRDGRCLELR